MEPYWHWRQDGSLACALHCDTHDCLTLGVVTLHIPPSGATTIVARQKYTRSCYNELFHPTENYGCNYISSGIGGNSEAETLLQGSRLVNLGEGTSGSSHPLVWSDRSPKNLTFYMIFFQKKHKHVFTISIISPHWHEAGSWNPSLCRTRT